MISQVASLTRSPESVQIFALHELKANIGQVMAISTLSLCYANPDVFKGEIRKNLGEVLTTSWSEST